MGKAQIKNLEGKKNLENETYGRREFLTELEQPLLPEYPDSRHACPARYHIVFMKKKASGPGELSTSIDSTISITYFFLGIQQRERFIFASTKTGIASSKGLLGMLVPERESIRIELHSSRANLIMISSFFLTFFYEFI